MGMNEEKEDAARAQPRAASADADFRLLGERLDTIGHGNLSQPKNPEIRQLQLLDQLALGASDSDLPEELIAALRSVILEAAETRQVARRERNQVAIERRRVTQIHEAALAAQADAEAKLAAAEAAARARAVRPRPRRAPPCDDAAGHRLRPDPLAARTPAELMETARQFREWAGGRVTGRWRPAAAAGPVRAR